MSLKRSLLGVLACTLIVGCGDSSPGNRDGGPDADAGGRDVRTDMADTADRADTADVSNVTDTLEVAAEAPTEAPAGETPLADGGMDADGSVGSDADGSGGNDAEVGSINTCGDGGANADAGSPDAADAAPAANVPANLTATVTDRRDSSIKLGWTAPTATAGGAVTSYEVRYSRSPIQACSFDDFSLVTKVPFVGTPAAPGQADGITIKSLLIQAGYYFAVASVDATGKRSGIAFTAQTVPKFNLTILDPPAGAASTEAFGSVTDASGDVNGDGKSDLLVGTYGVNHAYLYLGKTGAPSGAPSVVFTGGMDFGEAVAQIGDIDKDGLADLAIAEYINTTRVFIYKGRAVWPATLTDAQADYVISGDATYDGSILGSSMARLGDFDGDGAADFALGAPGFNTRQGRVVIVRGGTGFASLALPNAQRSITIDGDATLNRPQFGLAVVGLGKFYSTTTGTTLVVSAPGVASSATSDNQGRVYAFHGQAGVNGSISLAGADHSLVGTVKGTSFGQVLANLGAVVNTLPSVGIGNTGDKVSAAGINGTVFVGSGTSATGPFASKPLVYQKSSSFNGLVFFGAAVSGSDTALSIFGDGQPAFGIMGFQGTHISIVRKNTFAAHASDADFDVFADVQVPLPSGWFATSSGGVSPDLDGDGHPDLQFSEGSDAGRIALLW